MVTPKASSKMPLHQQLYVDLRSKIQSGEWKPGDLIPAESALTQSYNMSRITVRTALDHLVKDGFIDRFAGRGSFVKAAKPEERQCLTSFTDQVLNSGRTPSTKLIKLERFKHSEKSLPFATGETIVMIERLRLINGEPAVLMRSYLPERFVPDIQASHFEETGRQQSLLYILEQFFGIALDKGEETIAATCVGQEDASLLSLPEGDAIVEKICLVRNLKNEPVIYETALWCIPQTQLVQRRAAGD